MFRGGIAVDLLNSHVAFTTSPPLLLYVAKKV